MTAQRLERLAGALPPAAIAAALALCAARYGGYHVSTSHAVGLFLLALGIVLATSPRMRAGVRGFPLAAASGLAAFVAWSFLSITWAEVRGDAWESANLALLYLVVYVVCLLWPWTTTMAARVAAAFGVAVAGFGVLAVVDSAVSSDVARGFEHGLLVRPIGYHNANAAMFLLALWPLLALVARRDVSPVLRAFLFGTAVVLVELAILCQSRGALVAGALGVVVFLALVPQRGRTVAVLAGLGAVVAPANDSLLAVYSAAAGAARVDAVETVGVVLAVSFAAATGIGFLVAQVDARAVVSASVGRRINAVTVAAFVAMALGVAVVTAARMDLSGERLRNEWTAFRAGGSPEEQRERRGSHFSRGLATTRYDLWRVAAAEARSRPWTGVGAGNFRVAYLRDRKVVLEDAKYPHSIELQIVSQTGIVGSVLILAFVVLAVLAAWRERLGTEGARTAAGVAIVLFSYWAAHASIDWFWELPAVTGFVVAGLAVAARLQTDRPLEGLPTGRGLLLPVARVTVACVAMLGIASLLLPWLSAREITRAATVWRDDPEAAYAATARARRLNPLSERPDLVAGVIAGRMEDWEEMRAAFARAVERNPWSWYAQLELGVAEAQLGRPRASLAALARAEDLNPGEHVIDAVREGVRSGRPIPPEEIDRTLLQRALALVE